MKGMILMTQKDLLRLEYMRKIAEKKITQKETARLLNLTDRHIRRLYLQFKQHGETGIVANKYGKPSNRRYPEELRTKIKEILAENYYDFGPTFACEKLKENHNINISVGTVNTLMVESGLWVPRKLKLRRAYQPRYRRPCFGELIQIDGSVHDWFEGKSPKCNLLVYVDDATSKLMELKFVSEESTFTYFDATKEYILNHGKPVSFYSDKHSVFRPTQSSSTGKRITQFTRALGELNIDLICADSCEAKGRVERANKTLQDRLIKEMRLLNITTPEEGNKYLPEFITSYNAKFGKEPACSSDINRELSSKERRNLENIFTWQSERSLTKNLTFQYEKCLYMIEDSVTTRALKFKQIKVFEYPDGSIKVRYGSQELKTRKYFDKLQRVSYGEIVSNKRLGRTLEKIKVQQEERNEQLTKRKSNCHLKNIYPENTPSTNLEIDVWS
jgi:hypothetical protein